MPPRRKSGSRRSHRAPQQEPDAHQINGRISSTQVRLITDSGENLGVLSRADALANARETGLDLVLVSPNADPPVCRVMDYGKYKYDIQKREAKARKNTTRTSVKEVRLRYRTDVGDLETKLKHAREFLEAGDKVKFSMRFRGREIVYTSAGLEKIDTLVDQLSDVAAVEERSPSRGRQLYVVLSPKK